MDNKKVIIDLLRLVNSYWKVKRATVINDRYVDGAAIDDEKVRENLVEHVGLLPILVSFMHPYISKTDSVSLERTLAMLAIHDIGETITGDIPTSKKTEQNTVDEIQIVKGMLTEKQFELYMEFEDRKTETAMFAKAMDCLAVFVDDLLLPSEVAAKRLARWDFGVEKTIGYTEKYFLWDENLSSIYKTLMDEYRIIVNGETRILLVR